MRKLATVKIISELRPIENADKIELAVIDGWHSVVKKGEYQVNDKVVYIEIDAWVPNSVAPFLSKGEPKEFNGIKGERLKTVKLRGQISQGLVLPLTKDLSIFPEGEDVSCELGITKWEMPAGAALQGSPRGNFPGFLRKTDQERCQNLKYDIALHGEQGTLFEVTEKLDGSSMSAYFYDGVFGVCSRNIDLKEDDINTYWKVARELDLEHKMLALGVDYAIQGELIGPKIQGNPYKLDKHEFCVFDIFDIKNYTYLTSAERYELANSLGLSHVPVLSEPRNVISDIDLLLQDAEGKSILNRLTEREGLVYKSIEDPNFSFKVISNKFLLKESN